MFTYLDGSGFLGAENSAGADLALLISIAALVMLTIGVGLARTGRYPAHRWVQTVAVVLNTVPVVVWMIRSFWLYVRPDLPGNLEESVNALTTVHAVTGLVGVALGLSVVIRSNQLTARDESLGGYKTPMRAAYIVYLLGTALGVWVYVAIYG